MTVIQSHSPHSRAKKINCQCQGAKGGHFQMMMMIVMMMMMMMMMMMVMMMPQSNANFHERDKLERKLVWWDDLLGWDNLWLDLLQEVWDSIVMNNPSLSFGGTETLFWLDLILPWLVDSSWLCFVAYNMICKNFMSFQLQVVCWSFYLREYSFANAIALMKIVSLSNFYCIKIKLENLLSSFACVSLEDV